MLKVYDKNHNQLGWLVSYKDDVITSEIDTGDKTLSFSTIGTPEVEIGNEYYIRTKTDEFVVKKVHPASDLTCSYECVLNLEELDGEPVDTFSQANKSIYYCAGKALEGNVWSVDEDGSDIDGSVQKNMGIIDTSVLGVLQAIAQVWMCEIQFDSIAKKIRFRQKIGSDKGCYLATGLNMRKLDRELDSYNFYTVIRPIGANGLTIASVNGGSTEIENHSYSDKRRVFLWKDESYTDAAVLKADAEVYLEELAHPIESLSCDVIDLAKQSSRYSVFAFELGDIVTIIDPGTKVRAKHRIVKLEQHPREPWKNNCELANRKPKFTDMLDAARKAEEISSYVTNPNGLGVVTLSDLLGQIDTRLTRGGL